MSEGIVKRGPGRPPRAVTGDIGEDKPKVPELPWQSMGEAPKDGRTIELTPNRNSFVRASWYRTRTRRGGRSWVVVTYWADPVFHQKIGFEPVAWRPLKPFTPEAA